MSKLAEKAAKFFGLRPGITKNLGGGAGLPTRVQVTSAMAELTGVLYSGRITKDAAAGVYLKDSEFTPLGGTVVFQSVAGGFGLYFTSAAIKGSGLNFSNVRILCQMVSVAGGSVAVVPVCAVTALDTTSGVMSARVLCYKVDGNGAWAAAHLATNDVVDVTILAFN